MTQTKVGLSCQFWQLQSSLFSSDEDEGEGLPVSYLRYTE